MDDTYCKEPSHITPKNLSADVIQNIKMPHAHIALKFQATNRWKIVTGMIFSGL